MFDEYFQDCSINSWKNNQTSSTLLQIKDINILGVCVHKRKTLQSTLLSNVSLPKEGDQNVKVTHKHTNNCLNRATKFSPITDPSKKKMRK